MPVVVVHGRTEGARLFVCAALHGDEPLAEGVEDVRIGRMIEMDVADGTSDETLTKMCEQLLANMVIEDFAIEKVDPVGEPA